MGKMSEHYYHSRHDEKGETFSYITNSRMMRYSEGINGINFPVEFFSIVAIFAEDCNYGIHDLYSDSTRLFIRGRYRGKSNELMLRVYEGELTVARIEFVHQRKGNMVRLYKILKAIRKKYKLDRIKIESVMTEKCKNWCNKNGFVLDPYDQKSYIERV